MLKDRSFIPGPTPVPEKVALAMAQAPLHHRGEEFAARMHRVEALLQEVFCTQQPVLTLTSSGTGAAEAAVTNLFSRGDKGICINNGRFAARWGDMMRTFGMQTVDVPVDWGCAVDPDRLARALRSHPDARCVWVVQSETSTGVRTDLRAVADVVRTSSDALLCVDAVTSLGAEECRMDAWGLDVVITASQKALMTPPGLAFVALSERAQQAAGKAALPRYYFDLARAQERLREGMTPWTPAVTLIAGLECALRMIVEEGVEHVWRRHSQTAAALRAGLLALGLPPFGTPPSDAVTVARLPETGERFRRLLATRYRIATAAGQEQMKGKVFRIAHMGYCDEGDIVALLSAAERALRDTGADVEPGSGVRAAQELLYRQDVPADMQPTA